MRPANESLAIGLGVSNERGGIAAGVAGACCGSAGRDGCCCCRDERLLFAGFCFTRRARFLPELVGDLERVDAVVLPPQVFAARAVKLPVVAAAERDGEFVAHLAAERPPLGEAHMVGVGRESAAHEGRLAMQRTSGGPVAVSAGGNRQCALVDAAGIQRHRAARRHGNREVL
jgi:hypothetical protein